MGHPPKSATPSNSYNIFGIISKASSLADICRAFARKLNHGRKSSHRDEADSRFTSINEAYRVISTQKRYQETTFDIQKSSKQDDEEEELVISGPRLLSRTTSRLGPTTQNFSKSSSRRSKKPTPTDFYAHLQRSSSISSTTNPSFLSRTPSKRSTTPIFFSESLARRKPPPMEKKLECMLEELCYGCSKEVKITREIISNDGLIVQEEEYVTIKVKPGWRRGTKITFEGKGDERPGFLPADIIFVIEEKKHPVFQREGDDLELGVKIPLVQALTGCTIKIPTLGGGKTILNLVDEIIYPGYEKIIPGQGMPKHNEEGRRGDLRLRFLVSFPTDLSEEQRSQVATILKDCC